MEEFQSEGRAVPPEWDAALAQIEQELNRMLLLAELSASNADVDREVLQKTVEHLKGRIDRIADGLHQEGER